MKNRNQGHDVADRLRERAIRLRTEPDRQADAQFMEEQAKNVELFADEFQQMCDKMNAILDL